MKIEYEEIYYFDEEEKGRFTDFLRDRHYSANDFAKMCGISISLLSMLVNGKRPLNEKHIKIFNKYGFKVELK